MALVPLRTASETGYCDCVCSCYELASLRDEDTGKGSGHTAPRSKQSRGKRG